MNSERCAQALCFVGSGRERPYFGRKRRRILLEHTHIVLQFVSQQLDLVLFLFDGRNVFSVDRLQFVYFFVQ